MNMPWTLARQTAREAAKPLDAVEVPLADGLGLALASAVRALADQPTCDTSAMDGYAVCGPGPWTAVGRVAAGDPVPGVRLGAGEAFAVATGAPVPDGSDYVIPVELCAVEGALVRGALSQPGKHIRRRGEDWSAGDELVPAGSPVTPAVLGLAAAAGHNTLLVHRRPRVAVIVTGDELLHSGPPHPGRVRDAISPMLPGLLAGADLLGTTHLRDDPSALAGTLTIAEADNPPTPASALTTTETDNPPTPASTLTTAEADVLVTCGATSVGPADHLRRVLADLGAEILVSGVSCRPGHPMLLAVLPDGRRVVGLPGNPFAALAAVLTLLQPLLDALGGRTVRPPITAWLPDVGAHLRDTRLIPVTRTGATAVPVGHDRPGSLWGAALADALAVVPPGHVGGEVELLAYAGQRPV
ncbi:molybdopterin molybdotransferase MoeA [Lentzea sp. BCCO 10_0856]|uniref:Molybdopterin molybdenumtransferase n=1 Tax=Lentzea miocenica TaxID=3095431 RepID=A0ABU4SSV9_9PSEU|nr:molybdopterin molybdotransferase MoeA [Lentzea sp. BCCO 10_0856]MDX8028980.1 molybdopterin molybdotransferase MoeA [Lentzea sp. BCCO 10_0856]